VTELGDQKVLLDGWVETTAERDRAVKIAQMFVGEGNVSDMIQVRRLQQLRVDVVVLEISRDAMKQLGVEQPSAISFGEVTREENGGRVFIRLTDITSTLRMLIERNLAKVLSAPNAIAASGKEARFTVGGEIPIPMTMLGGAAAGVETPLGTGVLAQGVEFRQYGIILTVTGTIEPNGLIQLKLQTEVSAPDFGTAVNIGGANIPGFRTRTYQTEVELKPGETIVLAGLITSEDIRQWRRIPVLSSIPIIGELFKSRSFQRRETELAIFVTPRIVETEASFEANVKTARESERTRQSPNSITPSTAQKRRFEGKK
ncbi:MAG TPA: hypothetical protein EYP10_06390, partial [Armatimonadetes bacterium]|nr:hypothetical protein [Armatimonadota bacterium]